MPQLTQTPPLTLTPSWSYQSPPSPRSACWSDWRWNQEEWCLRAPCSRTDPPRTTCSMKLNPQNVNLFSQINLNQSFIKFKYIFFFTVTVNFKAITSSLYRLSCCVFFWWSERPAAALFMWSSVFQVSYLCLHLQSLSGVSVYSCSFLMVVSVRCGQDCFGKK